MGAIYRATQLSLERVVALQLLSSHLSDDTDFSKRFRREAVLQATLEHPNILPVYEAGESPELLAQREPCRRQQAGAHRSLARAGRPVGAPKSHGSGALPLPFSQAAILSCWLSITSDSVNGGPPSLSCELNASKASCPLCPGYAARAGPQASSSASTAARARNALRTGIAIRGTLILASVS
jgi:serine/threonine protein kinase